MRFTKRYLVEGTDEYISYNEYHYDVIDSDDLTHEQMVGVAIDSLGEHEDLEEEVGMGFLAISYMLKTGIYIKKGDDLVSIPGNELSLRYDNNKFFIYHDSIGCLDFKDYRKSWAISENELLLPF